LDRKTGKIATSDGKALYETDEFWTDVDDKLQKAIDKDLEAKGKSSKDLSKEDFRKLLINYRAAYMANVVDSVGGE